VKEIFLTIAATEGSESLLEDVIKPALKNAGYSYDDYEDQHEGDILRPLVVLNTTDNPLAIALMAGDEEESIVQMEKNDEI
jgi:hypothetical protein